MRIELIQRKTPPEWNVRPLNEMDFWDYCNDLKIIVQEAPLEQPAYSIVIKKQRYIFVHDELRGASRLFALYHELAHLWLHPPKIHFFKGWNEAHEIEANVVATCALIPRTRIVHWSASELAEEYPEWLINLRKTTLEHWKI